MGELIALAIVVYGLGFAEGATASWVYLKAKARRNHARR